MYKHNFSYEEVCTRNFRNLTTASLDKLLSYREQNAGEDVNPSACAVRVPKGSDVTIRAGRVWRDEPGSRWRGGLVWVQHVTVLEAPLYPAF